MSNNQQVQQFDVPKEFVDKNKASGRKWTYDIRVVLSIVAGNFGEFYDFGLIAACYPTLGKIFFPHSDDQSMILIRGLVASNIAFFARPFGAYIFARIADRVGRIRSLSLTIVLMSATTVLVGLLPTFETWGYFSMICFICLRLMQGMIVGGETPVAIVYLQEKFPNNPVLTVSFMRMGIWSGFAASSFAYSIAYSLRDYSEHFWRYPFIASILFAVLAIYFRRKLYEGKEFVHYKEKTSEDIGFWQAVKRDGKIRIVLITVISAIILMAVTENKRLLVIFMQTDGSFDQAKIAATNGLMSSIGIFYCLAIGGLYQRFFFNKVNVNKVVQIWFIPGFLLMAIGFFTFINGHLLLGLLILVAGVDMMVIQTEMWSANLPISFRVRLFGVTNGIGKMVTATWLPATYLYFMKNGGSPYFPFYVITPFVVLYVVILLILPEFKSTGILYSKKNPDSPKPQDKSSSNPVLA